MLIIKKAVGQVWQGAIQLYIIILTVGRRTLFTWLMFWGKWIRWATRDWNPYQAAAMRELCSWYVTIRSHGQLESRDCGAMMSPGVSPAWHMDSWLGELEARVAWHVWWRGVNELLLNMECLKPCLKHHAITWGPPRQSCWTLEALQMSVTDVSQNSSQIQDFIITLSILSLKVTASTQQCQIWSK